MPAIIQHEKTLGFSFGHYDIGDDSLITINELPNDIKQVITLAEKLPATELALTSLKSATRMTKEEFSENMQETFHSKFAVVLMLANVQFEEDADPESKVVLVWNTDAPNFMVHADDLVIVVDEPEAIEVLESMTSTDLELPPSFITAVEEDHTIE